MMETLGQSIPADTSHAISVSLPTWEANVGYEEGEEWVLSKMTTGYPRFFIHKSIQALAEDIVNQYGVPGEKAMLFPSRSCADRCIDFFHSLATQPNPGQVHRLDLVPSQAGQNSELGQATLKLSCVLYPASDFWIAKQFWQHTGEGVSSRQAEFCHKALEDGLLTIKAPAESVQRGPRISKGPRRYQTGSLSNIDLNTLGGKDSLGQSSTTAKSAGSPEGRECTQFIEERFGRNLDIKLAANAKLAVRRRIAGCLVEEVNLKDNVQASPQAEPSIRMKGMSEDDVYLYSRGMNAIFHSHRILSIARGPLKSICFGFPYTDTLKILQKWGPGCLFYGHGSSEDLDDLEHRLANGEKFLALFCEFPGNPLLKSPDLKRIRQLADKYDFAVVIDETIGNFINVRLLPDADIVVSSLTKVFSGDSNVMCGSAILNPKRKYYPSLKETMTREDEDNYWIEEALFLERNSRDFVSRIERIDRNAETICDVLHASPFVKDIHYPKCNSTKSLYDEYRNPDGGYGGLLSVTFHSKSDAVVFFDNLDTAKGPSLGTNFTLCSPYVILAHYTELDWAASFGVDADLVRVSVGLEEADALRRVFQKALDAVEASKGS